MRIRIGIRIGRKKTEVKVLSLFDGISCGMVALERVGIPVERYVAYEIEPNAIKISQKNYPQIEHCGDVTAADFTQYKGFDLLIGGSPCTNWSCAKNHKAKEKKELFINEGIGWELFKQYARALEEAKPRYFLYENNYRISQNIVEAITETLGVQPIMIDSALVSAQRRKRLYWTNIPGVTQPQDRGIVLRDIYVPDKSLVRTDKRILDTAVRKKNYVQYAVNDKHSTSQAFRLYYLDGKSPTIARCRTESKCNILIDDNDLSTFKIISPIEAERLQTLPDNYTEGVPKTRRFEAVGNGWTVDVIAHLLRGISV
jgi:DNA (cytosine-5)-methyltransferase 3A